MNTNSNRRQTDESRRDALRKLAYIPPAVFTLSAMPFSASYGSSGPRTFSSKRECKQFYKDEGIKKKVRRTICKNL